MVSMTHPARRSAEACGKRALARAERRQRRWLWRLARRRKLERWTRGVATFRLHRRDLIELWLGPAGQHTDAQVARQRELAAHNLQADRVWVGHSIWD